MTTTTKKKAATKKKATTKKVTTTKKTAAAKKRTVRKAPAATVKSRAVNSKSAAKPSQKKTITATTKSAATKRATVKTTPISKSNPPVKARLTMLQDEFEQLNVLKERLKLLGLSAKRSELMRGGIQLLSMVSDARLKSLMAEVPVIISDDKAKKK